MFATQKIKWLASIGLAGILLTLSVLGGKWGTTYAADSSTNAAPFIEFINPAQVLAGSSSKVMVIGGTGFGDAFDTAVRIKGEGNGVDDILLPFSITSTRIFVNIPFTYLVDPIVYDISVVMSTVHSLPTTPVTPWDVESNTKQFKVYAIQPGFLPQILKNP